MIWCLLFLVLIDSRNASHLTSLSRLQLKLRRSVVNVQQFRKRGSRVGLVRSASFLWKQTSLPATAVLKARVDGLLRLPIQRTHERDAGQDDRDRRLESGEDGGEHTAVCHVCEVEIG